MVSVEKMTALRSYLVQRKHKEQKKVRFGSVQIREEKEVSNSKEPEILRDPQIKREESVHYESRDRWVTLVSELPAVYETDSDEFESLSESE